MRRLLVQTQMTLDGYMAGADTILLGCVLSEGFIPFRAANPEEDGAEFFNATPRNVVSNTLTESPWAGVEILSGEFEASVRGLKESDGGTIIAYGGATLVSGLIRAGLVDDLHVFFNPVAIGAGLPVCGGSDAGAEGYLRFETAAVTRFDCGITALHRRPGTPT